jgi:hypothetical protein
MTEMKDQKNEDLRPVVLGSVAQGSSDADALALNALGVLTGSEDHKDAFEQCGPGQPCYTRVPPA